MPFDTPRTLEDVISWIRAHEVATEERWARITELWADKKASDTSKFTMLFVKMEEIERHVSKVELRVMYLCGIGSVVGALGGTLLSLIFTHLIKK